MSKKKNKHKEITAEYIQQVLEELYKDKSDMTYDILRSKILPGYWYSIGSNPRIRTGYGGAKLILDTCEESGIPAYLVAEDIICYTEQGVFPIKDLNVVKNG